jgi:hypothetical protein
MEQTLHSIRQMQEEQAAARVPPEHLAVHLMEQTLHALRRLQEERAEKSGKTA